MDETTVPGQVFETSACEFKLQEYFPTGPAGRRGPSMSRVDTAVSPIDGAGVIAATRSSPGEMLLKIGDSRVATDPDPLDTA
jgi:hypothetical protein